MNWRSLFIGRCLPVVFCALLAGCGGVSTPNPTPAEIIPATTAPSGHEMPIPQGTAGPSQKAGCDHPYFPLRAGATWTYQLLGLGPTFEYSQQIDQVSAEGAKMTMIVRDATIANEISCTDEGIRIGRIPTLSSEQAGGLSAQFTPVTVEGVYIVPEAKFVPGASWTAHYVMKGTTNAGGQQAEMTNDLTIAFEVVGAEEVAVPGGTFDALKVKQHMTSKATLQGAPAPLPAVTVDQFVWFVKDVGMVKSSVKIADGVEVVTEVMHFSIP